MRSATEKAVIANIEDAITTTTTIITIIITTSADAGFESTLNSGISSS